MTGHEKKAGESLADVLSKLQESARFATPEDEIFINDQEVDDKALDKTPVVTMDEEIELGRSMGEYPQGFGDEGNADDDGDDALVAAIANDDGVVGEGDFNEEGEDDRSAMLDNDGDVTLVGDEDFDGLITAAMSNDDVVGEEDIDVLEAKIDSLPPSVEDDAKAFGPYPADWAEKMAARHDDKPAPVEMTPADKSDEFANSRRATSKAQNLGDNPKAGRSSRRAGWFVAIAAILIVMVCGGGYWFTQMGDKAQVTSNGTTIAGEAARKLVQASNGGEVGKKAASDDAARSVMGVNTLSQRLLALEEQLAISPATVLPKVGPVPPTRKEVADSNPATASVSAPVVTATPSKAKTTDPVGCYAPYKDDLSTSVFYPGLPGEAGNMSSCQWWVNGEKAPRQQQQAAPAPRKPKTAPKAKPPVQTAATVPASCLVTVTTKGLFSTKTSTYNRCN